MVKLNKKQQLKQITSLKYINMAKLGIQQAVLLGQTTHQFRGGRSFRAHALEVDVRVTRLPCVKWLDFWAATEKEFYPKIWALSGLNMFKHKLGHTVFDSIW